MNREMSEQDIHNQRLAAWLAKDPAAVGAFYVGVKTTRIYCKPTCSARPLPANLVWFSDKQTAERAGFRVCRRCNP